MKKYTITLIAVFFFSLQLFAADDFDIDDLDSFFDDPAALEIEQSELVENPEEGLFESNTFIWTGDIEGRAGSLFGYSEALPFKKEFLESKERLLDPEEQLLLGLKARLSFDARPDRTFRVFGKFVLEYPFTTEVLSSTKEVGSSQYKTVKVNSFKVFELFSDFSWKDRLFFRFGKQTVAWGLSRFYQVADPLSIGVKDPTDPTADIEGPLALKITFPFGLHSLSAYSVLKESYVPDNPADATFRDAGIGLKADFLVQIPKNPLVGNGALTLGAYTQRKLSPKLIAGYSTAFGKFQVFTDQAVSFGLDSYRITNRIDQEATNSSMMSGGSTIYQTEKPFRTPQYSATLGTMYVNNEWDFTLYAEYMYNGAGSSDSLMGEKFLNRYYWEQKQGVITSAFDPTLSIQDRYGYQGKHNSAINLSWSELADNDKFALSVLYLQNWSELSGVLSPSITYKPFSKLSVEGGFNFVWGASTSEWVMKYADRSTGNPLKTSAYILFKLGSGKF